MKPSIIAIFAASFLPAMAEENKLVVGSPAPPLVSGEYVLFEVGLNAAF